MEGSPVSATPGRLSGERHVERRHSVSRVFRKVLSKFSSSEDASPPPSPAPDPSPELKELTGRPTHTPITPSPSSSGWRKGSKRTGRDGVITRGWLKVTVGQSRGLEWGDAIAPNLFVTLELCGQVYRTRVTSRDLAPVWNANFIFDVTTLSTAQQRALHDQQTPDQQSSEDGSTGEEAQMVVKLFHRSSAVAKVFLGSCVVSETMSFIAPTTVWVSVQQERFQPQGEKKAVDAVCEVQLLLHFMAGREEGANAEKQRQEQITRDLRREWILSQKLVDRQDVEHSQQTPRRFVEASDVSSHVEEDFEADMSEYGFGSAPSLSSASLAVADGGYVVEENLFDSTGRDDAPSDSLQLSGSGESLSEDVHHYVRNGAKVPVRPGSVASLAKPATMTQNGSSSDSSAPAQRDLGDFNERFQQAMEKMRLLDPNEPNFVERLTLNINLADLAQDFLYSASAYGKIIISEYNVPNHLKTIKEATVFGGLLGGKKYVVHNILFKFATDESGFFNSHQAAAKVAGNELRGLISYFGTGVEGLSFPLMCLLDFKGYRLVCSSLLPINKETTLVYGSSNAGRVFVNSCPELYEKATEASRLLNLKPHLIGTPEKMWPIHSPCDLEGHVGSDGRKYLLDFSRHMPPIRASKEYVSWKAPNMHLYRLMRPEFVASYETPLCADAFSGFMDQNTPNYKEDHEEVKEATRVLITVTIPAFGKELCRLVTEEARRSADGSIAKFRLTEALHRGGINVCFLGRVFDYPLLGKLVPQAKDLIVCEAVARVVKNLLRQKMRERVRELSAPLEKPFVYLVTQVLNDVFGNPATNQTTQLYWQRYIPARLREDYCFRGIPGDLFKRIQNIVFWGKKGQHSSSDDVRASMSLSSQDLSKTLKQPAFTSSPSISGCVTGFYLILERLISMLGLVFTDKVLEDLRNNPHLFGGSNPCFDNTDLAHLGERVKHLNVVSLARGYVQVFKGHKAAFLKDYVSSLRFYEMALLSYEEALNSTPNDPSLLRSYAKVYLEMEKAVLQRDNLQKRRLKDSPFLARADLFYRLSIAANKEDTVPLAEYASFLEFVREYDAAEQHYLQALTIDPNDAYCLRKYASFLQDVRQNICLAERFLQRSQQTSRVLEQISKGDNPLESESRQEGNGNHNNAAVRLQLPVLGRTRGRSRSEDATGAEQQETRLRSFSHKDLRNATPFKQAVAAVSVPLEIDASNERVPVMIINDKFKK